MRLKNIKEQLRNIVARPESREALEVLVRDVGDELPRRRLPLLREFRAEAAAACDLLARQGRAETAFQQDVLRALIELCAAYDAAVTARKDRIALRRRVQKEPFRSVLRELLDREQGVSGAAESRKPPEAEVASALQSLVGWGLAEAVPAQGADPRAAEYRLTPEAFLLLPPSCVPGHVRIGQILKEKLSRFFDRHSLQRDEDLEKLLGKVVTAATQLDVRSPYLGLDRNETCLAVADLICWIASKTKGLPGAEGLIRRVCRKVFRDSLLTLRLGKATVREILRDALNQKKQEVAERLDTHLKTARRRRKGHEMRPDDGARRG